MKVKILANATIVIITLCVLLNGYAMSIDLPVYADETTDSWMQVTTNQQLVEAFRYYCKSRDLTIEGSVADAVTTFTTKTFNGLCNTLGINVTALQAQIKYQTDGNTGTKFLFNALGIDAYNRIFAQFLQDNNLSVGDSADEVNNELYSGIKFTDRNGNSCLCYVFTADPTGNSALYDMVNNFSSLGYIGSSGTTYLYDAETLSQFLASSYDTYITIPDGNTNNISLNLMKHHQTTASPPYYINDDICYYQNNTRAYFYGGRTVYNGQNSDEITNADQYKGDMSIGYYNNKYYLCNAVIHTASSNQGAPIDYYCVYGLREIHPASAQNISIYLTTNNSTINNNNYEGDTVINNEGDVTINNNGGGGTTTPPSDSGGSGGDISFPNFNFQLPEINWSLGDLSNKFPFSIPFDMIAFLTLLNGEPQAPHITGTIPLTSHYTWELDLDFSQFDTFAGIMRGLEFVGFMFFLISATLNIVRG